MDLRTFDSTFTTSHLQMLKVLLPYLPPASQSGLAIYIKMQELQYTLEYMKHHPRTSPLLPKPEENCLFEQLLPYCSPSQKEQIQQFQQMNQQMESIRDAMEMAKMMQDLFPEGATGENMDFSQVMSMFSAMGNDSPFQAPPSSPSPSAEKNSENTSENSS